MIGTSTSNSFVLIDTTHREIIDKFETGNLSLASAAIVFDDIWILLFSSGPDVLATWFVSNTDHVWGQGVTDAERTSPDIFRLPGAETIELFGAAAQIEEVKKLSSRLPFASELADFVASMRFTRFGGPDVFPRRSATILPDIGLGYVTNFKFHGRYLYITYERGVSVCEVTA